MLLEQPAKNMDVHWGSVFRKTTGYLKNLMMLTLAPWMALSILMMIGLLGECFTGELGRNGGLTGLFQDMGLYPHTTYEAFLWIIGVGVFFAIAWLLWRVVEALFEAAGRQIQKTGLEAWITRKTAPLTNALESFANNHPYGLLAMFAVPVIVSVVLIATSPTPKDRGIVWPPGGPQSVQASPYSRVLLEVPVPVRKHPNGMPRPATRTISGKAMVTQIAPQTYQVRIIP